MKREQFGVRRQRRRFGSHSLITAFRVDPKRRRRALRPPHSKLVIGAPTIGLLILFSLSTHAQQLSRDEWGAMPVSVSHQNGNWIIAGRKQKVSLNDHTLAINIEAGPARWATLASTPHDMLV